MKNNLENIINERFRQVRAQKNLSQSEFGSVLNQNQQSITDIESGRKKINAELMRLLLKKYGVNINWLLTGEGEMYLPKTISNQVSEPQIGYGLLEVVKAKDEVIASYKSNIELLNAEIARLRKKCGEEVKVNG